LIPIAPEPLPLDLAGAIAGAAPRLGGFARVTYLSDTASTNDVALSLAASGAPEGTAVLADLQRAGRGRRGGAWFSPPGAGVYLSVVVRPGALSGRLSIVTLAAGVAAAQAVVASTALPVELKWPNDLVIGRPWRKLGGLLCESVGAGASIDAVVVGIGINVRTAAYPIELADRATALETELGRSVDRAALVVATLQALHDVFDRLRSDGTEWVGEQWRRFGKAGLDGASIRWHDQSGERRGLARGLDETGALVVDCAGRTERLISGEVQWERLSSD
jgi:BirA family biotin operon repressor/biotin-[acetyl-CoA-carboxylase] ligase